MLLVIGLEKVAAFELRNRYMHACQKFEVTPDWAFNRTAKKIRQKRVPW